MLKVFYLHVHLFRSHGISISFQVLEVIHHYFIHTCMRPERQITLGIIYGYKALLQLLAVVLALKTRKVKVKGLDDSKYIIAATYISSLVLLTVIIMTYTAQEYIHTYAVVTSVSFLLGSTIIVGLVFIPKVSEIRFGTCVSFTTNTPFCCRWCASIKTQSVQKCL